jgi:hypothetical protein
VDALRGEGVASACCKREARSTVCLTERNHVAIILAKPGVHSQLQAVLVALRYAAIELR